MLVQVRPLKSLRSLRAIRSRRIEGYMAEKKLTKKDTQKSKPGIKGTKWDGNKAVPVDPKKVPWAVKY